MHVYITNVNEKTITTMCGLSLEVKRELTEGAHSISQFSDENQRIIRKHKEEIKRKEAAKEAAKRQEEKEKKDKVRYTYLEGDFPKIYKFWEGKEEFKVLEVRTSKGMRRGIIVLDGYHEYSFSNKEGMRYMYSKEEVLKKAINNSYDHQTGTVVVPENRKGMVIGRGGETIKALSAFAGKRIKLK